MTCVSWESPEKQHYTSFANASNFGVGQILREPMSEKRDAS